MSHHFPCPCGAELADECPRCARTNPLGSMRIEPPVGSTPYDEYMRSLVAAQLPPVAISPTVDAATVQATLDHIVNPMRAEGHSRWFVANVAAEHLAEQVAQFGREQEVADAVRGIGPRWDDTMPDDYDPTDAERRLDLMAEGWSERNANVMRLVADIESGAAS